MQHRLTPSLKRALSAERLEPYLIGSVSGADPLAWYLWNVCLTEALYPILHGIEVSLRNSLHETIHRDTGDASWMLKGGLLQKREADQVRDSSSRLESRRKGISSGRVVAELSFGFWTSLLDKRYEGVLWPRLLSTAFPEVPRPLRTRADLSVRLNEIRRLRNRAFHHEPIWHWRDLPQQHAHAVEMLFWLCKDLGRMTATADRFADVYADRPAT